MIQIGGISVVHIIAFFSSTGAYSLTILATYILLLSSFPKIAFAMQSLASPPWCDMGVDYRNPTTLDISHPISLPTPVTHSQPISIERALQEESNGPYLRDQGRPYTEIWPFFVNETPWASQEFDSNTIAAIQCIEGAVALDCTLWHCILLLEMQPAVEESLTSLPSLSLASCQSHAIHDSRTAHSSLWIKIDSILVTL